MKSLLFYIVIILDKKDRLKFFFDRKGDLTFPSMTFEVNFPKTKNLPLYNVSILRNLFQNRFTKLEIINNAFDNMVP